MRISVVDLGRGRRSGSPRRRARGCGRPGRACFLRTRYLPEVESLLAEVAWESFDAEYDRASSLAEVEVQIADRLLAASALPASLASGSAMAPGSVPDVVFAVPGDGAVGEAILERLRAAGAAVDVVPGVPLGTAALAAAGLDASVGAQLIEATALGGAGIDLLVELNPRWPAVVTGVFSPSVASELKLALQRVYPAEHRVRWSRIPVG